jgi:PII-like signaling protein
MFFEVMPRMPVTIEIADRMAAARVLRLLKRVSSFFATSVMTFAALASAAGSDGRELGNVHPGG